MHTYLYKPFKVLHEKIPNIINIQQKIKIFAYSKSVTDLSSETGTKEMTFFWRPSTQAVSVELVNTRPGRWGEQWDYDIPG